MIDNIFLTILSKMKIKDLIRETSACVYIKSYHTQCRICVIFSLRVGRTI